jgi:hypothetical protein
MIPIFFFICLRVLASATPHTTPIRDCEMESLQQILVDGQTEYEGKPFPLCVTPMVTNMDDFLNWITTHRQELDQLLKEYKAIYFRNAPLKSVSDFHDVIVATGLNDMAYVGGAAVRTQITSRVFTSNESPSSEKIPFHHEMSQVPEPPTHLFFYCEVPSEIGGEVGALSSVQSTHPLLTLPFRLQSCPQLKSAKR